MGSRSRWESTQDERRRSGAASAAIANAATHLSTSAPIRLGGVPLDSGTYTLWTLPTARDAELIINRETGQWGTAYRAEQDIARVAMARDALATPVEAFTFRVDRAPPRLVMEGEPSGGAHR